MEYVRIVIDTEGSDKGASMVVKGAADALAKYENLAIVLVGDRDKLLTECSSLGIEEGERVDFLRRLRLHPEEALEAGPARTLRDRGAVPRALVVRERDAVHACGDGAADNFRRGHLEARARREA